MESGKGVFEEHLKGMTHVFIGIDNSALILKAH
jgi:hypothetical protein